MIKTHTNPELLNDLRKLCKGVKEIVINFSTNEDNHFDYLWDHSVFGYFYDNNQNYIDYDKLKDAYDAIGNEEDGIGGELWFYLSCLLNVSKIHLSDIWWQGCFRIDLENGVVILEGDNDYDIDNIRDELEYHNPQIEIEEYLNNLPGFYYDENQEKSKMFAPYGYGDNDIEPIEKFLMCNEI